MPGPIDRAGTIPQGSTERWKDKKRYLWLIALVMPSLVFAALGLHALTGWGLWLWIGPIVILGIVPVIDLMTGLDRSNPPDELIAALESDKYYRWITYLFLPLQYAGFATAFWFLAHANLSVVDKVGLALTIGFIGGIGINTAHELGHKKEKLERWLSKIALAQSFYGHFYIEHNHGHHSRVATPQDPASSRVGESFYRFWPRTVLGSLTSAWLLEKRRCARRGQHPFRIGNDVLNAWLMSLVLWAVVLAWLGIGVLPYLVLQAVIALTLLEAVNYLEHYGMLRQRVGAPGHERYERVAPSHSWNSNNIATNVLLYHLQRHSDHHANPTRRYQALRDYQESPVLPTGYAGMILVALVPRAWRRVMDPRVLTHFGGEISRANIQPRQRAKVLARYAPPTVPPNGETAALATLAAQATEETRPQPDEARQHDHAVRTATRRSSPTSVPQPDESSPQPDDETSPQPDEASPAAGIHGGRCPGCDYVYLEAVGDPREGFPAGTSWSAVPDTWCCPDCGVREKTDFIIIRTLRQ